MDSSLDSQLSSHLKTDPNPGQIYSDDRQLDWSQVTQKATGSNSVISSDPGTLQGGGGTEHTLDMSTVNVSLIITVSFFGTLGLGMVAVMLAGLWFRFCGAKKSKNPEDLEQAEDVDYKHLQMISSRSNSFNPVSNQIPEMTKTDQNSTSNKTDNGDDSQLPDTSVKGEKVRAKKETRNFLSVKDALRPPEGKKRVRSTRSYNYISVDSGNDRTTKNSGEVEVNNNNNNEYSTKRDDDNLEFRSNKIGDGTSFKSASEKTVSLSANSHESDKKEQCDSISGKNRNRKASSQNNLLPSFVVTKFNESQSSIDDEADENEKELSYTEQGEIFNAEDKLLKHYRNRRPLNQFTRSFDGAYFDSVNLKSEESLQNIDKIKDDFPNLSRELEENESLDAKNDFNRRHSYNFLSENQSCQSQSFSKDHSSRSTHFYQPKSCDKSETSTEIRDYKSFRLYLENSDNFSSNYAVKSNNRDCDKKKSSRKSNKNTLSVSEQEEFSGQKSAPRCIEKSRSECDSPQRQYQKHNKIQHTAKSIDLSASTENKLQNKSLNSTFLPHKRDFTNQFLPHHLVYKCEEIAPDFATQLENNKEDKFGYSRRDYFPHISQPNFPPAADASSLIGHQLVTPNSYQPSRGNFKRDSNRQSVRTKSKRLHKDVGSISPQESWQDLSLSQPDKQLPDYRLANLISHSQITQATSSYNQGNSSYNQGIASYDNEQLSLSHPLAKYPLYPLVTSGGSLASFDHRNEFNPANHNLQENSQNTNLRHSFSDRHNRSFREDSKLQKKNRPNLTRQAQIAPTVANSRDKFLSNIAKPSRNFPTIYDNIGNLDPRSEVVSRSHLNPRTPPITVSRTFDMGEVFSTCGGNSGKTELRDEGDENRGRRKSGKVFRKHHSTCVDKNSNSDATNEASISTLVHSSPRRSQEFLTVPQFQPGGGLGPPSIINMLLPGDQGHDNRRSSFGDRSHPAWKSADSYRDKPEFRRSFDDRMCIQGTSQNHLGQNNRPNNALKPVGDTCREKSHSQEVMRIRSSLSMNRSSNQSPHGTSTNSSFDRKSPRNSRQNSRQNSQEHFRILSPSYCNSPDRERWAIGKKRSREGLGLSPRNSCDSRNSYHGATRERGRSSSRSPRVSPKISPNNSINQPDIALRDMGGNFNRSIDSEHRKRNLYISDFNRSHDSTDREANAGHDLWNLRATMESSWEEDDEEDEFPNGVEFELEKEELMLLGRHGINMDLDMDMDPYENLHRRPPVNQAVPVNQNNHPTSFYGQSFHDLPRRDHDNFILPQNHHFHSINSNTFSKFHSTNSNRNFNETASSNVKADATSNISNRGQTFLNVNDLKNFNNLRGQSQNINLLSSNDQNQTSLSNSNLEKSNNRSPKLDQFVVSTVVHGQHETAVGAGQKRVVGCGAGGFGAASFDSSGTADSECSGAAQVVGTTSGMSHEGTRKFSSSFSINDDSLFNDQEYLSDSNQHWSLNERTSSEMQHLKSAVGAAIRAGTKQDSRRIMRNSTPSFTQDTNRAGTSTDPRIQQHTSGSIVAMRPHHHGCSKELDSGAPREHSNKSSGIGGCGCGGATQQSSNPPARNKSESAMSSMSELGVKSRLSYTLSNKEDDSLELESLKERIVQETEKSAELAKSRRHAYQKRRSGQISESFETPNKAQMTSRVEGSGHVIPIFVGGELNSSFTSSGSLNDTEFDSPINVNRRLLPPSYRSVLPAGRDYSIDKKTDMIFREFLKTDSATLLKLKYGFKSPRRMRRSPRNSKGPRIKQEDSIEETEGESNEGSDPNLQLGQQPGETLTPAAGSPESGHVAAPGDVSYSMESGNHLTVGYVPMGTLDCAGSDWYHEDFKNWRTRRLLPPIKSQDSTSSDHHQNVPGSTPLSRNPSISKS